MKGLLLSLILILSSQTSSAISRPTAQDVFVQGGAGVICSKETAKDIGFLALTARKLMEKSLAPEMEIVNGKLILRIPMVFTVCVKEDRTWNNVVIEPNFKKMEIPLLYALDAPRVRISQAKMSGPYSDIKFDHIYLAEFMFKLSDLLTQEESQNIDQGIVYTKAFSLKWGPGSRGYSDIFVRLSK